MSEQNIEALMLMQPQILTKIFIYYMQNDDLERRMNKERVQLHLVCCTWARVFFTDAVCGAIPPSINPIVLPAGCYNWLTMMQKVRLPNVFPVMRTLTCPLRERYCVPWIDIVESMDTAEDVALMLTHVHYFITDYFIDVFARYEQFRRYVLVYIREDAILTMARSMHMHTNLFTYEVLTALAAKLYSSFIRCTSTVLSAKIARQQMTLYCKYSRRYE